MLLVCIGFVAGSTVAVGWELAKRTFALRRCRRIAREPSVCRRERGLSKVERSVNCPHVGQEFRIILPALFKVDANPCNVALLGSTPRVSEKSLDCFQGQHVLYGMRDGRRDGEAGQSRIGSLIGNVHDDTEAKVFSRVLLILTEGGKGSKSSDVFLYLVFCTVYA